VASPYLARSALDDTPRYPERTVTTYSQQQIPHQPAGATVPSGVRSALLDWLNDHGVDHRDIWKQLMQRVGYGGPVDVVEDVAARFGEQAREPLQTAFITESRIRRPIPPNDRNRYAMPGLLHVPAPLFLDALEIGVELAGKEYTKHDEFVYESHDHAAIEEINRIFTVRGINYRFTPLGKAEWHGDEQAYQQVIAPALGALSDPRLAGAAQEFGDAIAALRLGTREGEKNAIRDASNAVESAMKSVIDDHAISRTGNETADPLWQLLKDENGVADKTKDPICAAPRLRNTYGGHGPNPQPDPVPPGVAEYTVNVAASAIVYLADQLNR
jgi:hypothetical protein